MSKTDNNVIKTAQRGFTLIELLVVVAILGILGAIATTSIVGHIDDSRKTAAKQSVDSISGAISSIYMREHSKLPTDLKVLIEDRGDKGPILEGGEGALEDPWGNPYRIEVKGKRFVVISDGPDEQAGTEDDIRSDTIEKKNKNK